ncbi:hypothetical protein ABZ234_17565 [Nocardiopsis sp. NPDC006198]|uniref:hypothetical protein n=1 Tax=Nocardiopsis sp. NPDC006198 TaxID=3154472 RepID=UPI0033B47181
MPVKHTMAALLLTSFSTLALGAAPAQAAEGALVINGTEHRDPRGCYDTDRWPLVVDNRTDGPVHVFSDPGCTGRYVTTVDPGERKVDEHGQSVHVA